MEKWLFDLQLFADNAGENNEGEVGATLDEGQQDQKPLTLEEIQKLIQSETDKVRTEYSKKIKAIEQEKEELLKEKMTEEEKAKFELEQREKAIAEREAELNRTKLEVKTIELLKENGLDLDFKAFVMGDNEESTVERLTKFKEIWQTALEKAVEGRFKENGREVYRSSSTKTELQLLKDQYNQATKLDEKLMIKRKIEELEKQ